MRCVGVVLTGGRSSRMGRPKALVELEGRSFLSRILEAMDGAGIAEAVIVTGTHDSEIRAHLARSPRPGSLALSVVTNLEPDRGQLSSLRLALDAVEGSPAGAPADAVLVALVDHPLVRTATMKALLDAFERTRAPVVRPVFEGRHGHPVLFAREVFAALREAAPDGGARTIVRGLGPRVRDVAVDDPGVCLDVDTPEALADARRLPP